MARPSPLTLVVIFPVSDSVVAHRLHPWAFVKFVVFVLYSLVMSSWEVIKVIVRPTPGVAAVGHRARPPASTSRR